MTSVEGSGSSNKAFKTNIAIMTPVKPMLAKKVTTLEECFKRSPGGIFAEIKYDGERIQIHKSNDEYKCYSRNLKLVQDWKVKKHYTIIITP